MKKKLLPIIMILILLMTAPVQAFAARPDMETTGLKYLSIGDSIAVGLTADEGYSYFDLYSEYLSGERYGLASAINLSAEGLDSMELLEALEDNTQLRAVVSQADVITISIGGNNLLTPVIGTVAGLYGINPALYPSSEAFMVALLGAISSPDFGGPISKGIWEAKLAAFTAQALSSDFGTLGWLLEARTAQFLSDWPAILDAIEDVNPDAHIIAMTIYNPIEKDDNKDLYHRYEELVRPMNKAIMKTQNRAMVAKVEKAFSKEPGAVAFKLTWTSEFPPVLIDPHPTTLGHGIIFEELMKTRNPRSF